MKNKIIEFLELIPKDKKRITMQEIFSLFLENDHLSSSKGDIYFIVSLTKTLEILIPTKKSEFELNWDNFYKIKSKWGFK